MKRKKWEQETWAEYKETSMSGTWSAQQIWAPIEESTPSLEQRNVGLSITRLVSSFIRKILREPWTTTRLPCLKGKSHESGERRHFNGRFKSFKQMAYRLYFTVLLGMQSVYGHWSQSACLGTAQVWFLVDSTMPTGCFTPGVHFSYL